MVIASELREGVVLRIEGQIYKVLEVESKAGAAKMSGMVKTKLINVRRGRMWEPHFRPQEKLEDLQLERRTMEFLYADGDNFTFMHPETFDQFGISGTVVGAAKAFLRPGMELPVEFFDDEPTAWSFLILPTRWLLIRRHRRIRNKTAPGKKPCWKMA